MEYGLHNSAEQRTALVKRGRKASPLCGEHIAMTASAKALQRY